ncbi:WD-40 repeat-containing protein [Chytridium lagenaria]|nr:WD-40 repeat-containing protein [Chytridium lagenaria]
MSKNLSQSPMFKLSAVLTAHTQDVRGVTCANSDTLFSVSRDSKLLSWRRLGATSIFEVESTFEGHSHFINAVTYVHPVPEFPNGLIVTGGSDKLINVYDMTQKNPLYTLIGHSDTVCALATSGTTIVSGSWDKTARVWVNFSETHVLQGHEQAVWAVLPIASGAVLTGSADKTIKMWDGGKCIKTFKGHTDAVRGLAYISENEFLSASNDSSLKLWNLNGTCLKELFGHSSFVYSIDVLPSGDYISGGEDRSVRIWNGIGGTESVQDILMPCTSIWGVKALPNGDIACACSDGQVRIFTTESSRFADAETTEAFEKGVSEFAISSCSDKARYMAFKTSPLIFISGRKGQVVMIKNNGSIEAHQWSDTDAIWVKVGTVVDSIGSNRKQLFHGKEYDYVFDVDIGEGPSLKLPFNASDNPYAAAQQFIYDHELPQDYLDKIAQFIIQNAEGVSLTTTTGYSNPDPFTGNISWT